MLHYTQQSTDNAVFNYKFIRHLIKLTSLILCLVSTILIIGGYHVGAFSSIETLQSVVSQTGSISIYLFIILQVIQVIVPIIPNPIICLVGVILFGPVQGFFYNYMGVCFGSLIAFALAKKYGQNVLAVLFKQSLRDKYKKMTTSKLFNQLYTLAIIFPGLPDDFLCYLAGTTSMTYKKFITINLIGRIFTLAAYSLFFDYMYQSI